MQNELVLLLSKIVGDPVIVVPAIRKPRGSDPEITVNVMALLPTVIGKASVRLTASGNVPKL
jgi:hypothetical protein